MITAVVLVVIVGAAVFLATHQSDGGGIGGTTASGSPPEVQSGQELFDAVGETAGCTGDFVSDPPTEDFERGGCPTADDRFLVFEVFESAGARDRLLARSGLDCSIVDDAEDAVDDFGGVSVIGANWEISELSLVNARALHDRFGVEFQACE